ncbi:MAG: SDR family oxidoreductase [bacterium]
MKRNSGRLAVVTGANRGIGLEICRQLARTGATVVLTARGAEKGNAACASLEKQGLQVLLHQLDVTELNSIQNLLAFVKKEFARLDILVNNAGIYLDRDKLALNVELDLIRKTMETNVYGPLRLSQTFIPLMRQNHYGRIVNVSSSMGALSGMEPGSPAYRISKTCLNALTRILAEEVKGSNILVNSVSPGWVQTDMGGPQATRAVAEGAETAVWLATLPDDGPTGGFFRDKKPIAW